VVVGLALAPIGVIPLPRHGGGPSPVTCTAGARNSAGVSDETSAEYRPIARQQEGVGDQYPHRRIGEPTLEFCELLVALRPSPIGWHSMILADAHARPGRIAQPMATLVV
jgi:hypothetical protein